MKFAVVVLTQSQFYSFIVPWARAFTGDDFISGRKDVAFVRFKRAIIFAPLQTRFALREGRIFAGKDVEGDCNISRVGSFLFWAGNSDAEDRGDDFERRRKDGVDDVHGREHDGEDLDIVGHDFNVRFGLIAVLR